MAIKVSKAKERANPPQPRALVADMQNLLSLAWPLDQWLRWQAELLKAAGPSLNGFLVRRGEGLSAGLRAGEKLAACRDLNEALAIQSEWIDGAMQRLDLDIQAVGEHALALSRSTAGATQRAAQAATELATRGVEQVLRAATPGSAPPEVEAAIADPPAIVRGGVAEPPANTKAAA